MFVTDRKERHTMFARKLAVLAVTLGAFAAAAPGADARVAIRWERLTVPFAAAPADDAATAKGSSAVVSLGKLGRVE